MAILHGHPVSQPARAVQWYIDYAEKKDVTVRKVELSAGEHKSPEFLAKFPAGQVPCFEDGDFCLAESLAILLYLSEGDELSPSKLGKREAARLNEYFGRHYSQVRKFTLEVVSKMFFAKPEDKERLITEGLKTVTPMLEKYDELLKKQDYVLGSSVSLADFLFAPEVDQLQFLPGREVLAPYAGIKAYLKRLEGVRGYSACWGTAKAVVDGLAKKQDA